MSTYRKPISALVLTSGLAALSWEVLWQIKAALALGVSAWGTALTLAITMGGMSAGALAMGTALRHRSVARPLRFYAYLEIVIALCGLLLIPGFRLVESIDTSFYAANPSGGIWMHMTGIALMLCPPAMAMGATMPVLGLIARQSAMSVAGIYGLNTIGAAAGTLLAALFLIPTFGVAHTVWTIAALNILVAAIAWSLDSARKTPAPYIAPAAAGASPPRPMEWLIVGVTGFSTFMLEVAWFRSLTAAYSSTTTAFAIMLAAVLLALGLGARMAPWVKRHGFPLGLILTGAGFLVLALTPVIERFDMFSTHELFASTLWIINKFILTIGVLGLPILLIGIALPWILDDQHTPRRWGALYSFNALCAIAGALSAGWVFLPLMGFAKTAWLAGILLAATGILAAPPQRRAKLTGLATIGILLAAVFESGVGTTRALGWKNAIRLEPKAILETFEGPDVTASVVEYETGFRALLIDGFAATAQSRDARNGKFSGEHYMIWMGHLPMLMHPAPRHALVICFGTGQTANAVRREGLQSLDIVDINKNVFRLARHFDANDNILKDERVNPVTMDGRAFIRRTTKTFDVITLEPMPPTFAGVNALYAREFYALARSKMSPDGVIAQWLPFHLVTPYQSASIARTFQDVFPNAVLWLDPHSRTGILLGSNNDATDMPEQWPGLARPAIERTLTSDQIRGGITLSAGKLRLYGEYGDIITDDNQLLAYHSTGLVKLGSAKVNAYNLEQIDALARQSAP